MSTGVKQTLDIYLTVVVVSNRLPRSPMALKTHTGYQSYWYEFGTILQAGSPSREDFLWVPFRSDLVLTPVFFFRFHSSGSSQAQYKKNKRVVEIDHNLMIAEFSISVPKRKPRRVEMFNLRNRVCLEAFLKKQKKMHNFLNV